MLRRALLLLAFLPALCLGLLGQGHGMVLCREACGSIALEVAHAEEGHHHAACGHDEGSGPSCRDVALDAGDHVAPAPVKVPDLTAYPCGHFVLAWCAPIAVRAVAAWLSPQVSWRGPPESAQTPPDQLRALRSVVLLV